MNTKEILFALSALAAPAGYEAAASEMAKTLLQPHCDEVKTDRLGNVFGWVYSSNPSFRAKNPKGQGFAVLIDAHLDEIGIIVTGERDGFYTFQTIGRTDPRILPACEFTLMAEEPVKAVVACLPPHVMKPEESDKSQRVEDLFLDTGGAAVRAGTVGVFSRQPAELGRLWTGKAFDDRACFVAILRALELIDRDKLEADIVVCGSVQEEVGGRGALVAGYGVHPDIAVTVDVTHGTTPDAPALGTFRLGGGVCINKGPDCNRALTERLIETAKAKDIPYQVEVTCGMSGTNATAYQEARDGVASAVLSVPLRYMHTPAETLHPDDIENCACLIREWVNRGC